MMDKYIAEIPGLRARMEGDLAMGWLVDSEEVANAVAFLLSA